MKNKLLPDSVLGKIVTDFVVGLLKRANVKHAGNCLAMCQILKPYLSVFFGVETLIMNCKVKQGRKKVNHYYLFRVCDGIIIDATASQFVCPNGKKMPTVFIGQKPNFYANP